MDEIKDIIKKWRTKEGQKGRKEWRKTKKKTEKITLVIKLPFSIFSGNWHCNGSNSGYSVLWFDGSGLDGSGLDGSDIICDVNGWKW